jgi:integrase
MADLFRKQTVVSKTPDGKKCNKDTPGAVKHILRSRKWYGTVNGQAVPLCVDKAKARQMLAKRTSDAALAGVGLGDPYAEHRKRPLTEHLKDYRKELAARGNDSRYVADVISRLEALLEGCRFVFTTDLSGSTVMDWLANLRAGTPAPAPLDPGKGEFTLKEAAVILGIKPASVGTAVRRLRLAATGKGKARRLPRATVEAMQDRLCRGASVETSNQYLSHLKSFCRWLVKDRRMGDNPITHLEAGNVEVDRRHDRRELLADELRRLLAVTRVSDRAYRGLSGHDRFHLYAAACGTGFRASGLASLTPGSFNLVSNPPTVTLAARRNKSRVLKVQPLPPDVAALLRAYLEGKPARQPIWGGTWAKDRKGAEMLRLDLEAAGIPYEVPGPDGPLFADFHALRHTYLTLGSRAGIDLRTLQELAGHSTPELTARYTHRRLHDLAGAVEMLPSFLPGQPDAGAAQLRPTGTDGADSVCSGFARTPAREGHLLASAGTEEGVESAVPEMTQPQVSLGFSHLLTSADIASLKGG